jgi:hypothetical protein
VTANEEAPAGVFASEERGSAGIDGQDFGGEQREDERLSLLASARREPVLDVLTRRSVSVAWRPAGAGPRSDRGDEHDDRLDAKGEPNEDEEDEARELIGKSLAD